MTNQKTIKYTILNCRCAGVSYDIVVLCDNKVLYNTTHCHIDEVAEICKKENIAIPKELQADYDNHVNWTTSIELMRSQPPIVPKITSIGNIRKNNDEFFATLIYNTNNNKEVTMTKEELYNCYITNDIAIPDYIKKHIIVAC